MDPNPKFPPDRVKTLKAEGTRAFERSKGVVVS